MLLTLRQFQEEAAASLMALYREGNEVNAAAFYPHLEKEEGVKKIEGEFTAYLRDEFFAQPGNTYYILEEEGEWVSALRLYPLPNGEFYLEALETRPEYRNKGCASRLLTQVISLLKEQGGFVLRDSVSKKNTASLAVHKKCGFVIEQEAALNCLTGKTNSGCFGLVYRYLPLSEGLQVCF